MSIEQAIDIFRDAGFEVKYMILGMYQAGLGMPYNLAVRCEGITVRDYYPQDWWNPLNIPMRLKRMAERILKYTDEYPVGVVSCAMKAMAKISELEGDNRFNLE